MEIARLHISQEEVERRLSVIDELDFGGSGIIPPAPPEYGYGERGEDDFDPEYSKPARWNLISRLAGMLSVSRLGFFPNDAPSYMSEHFGNAEKRNDPRPTFAVDNPRHIL